MHQRFAVRKLLAGDPGKIYSSVLTVKFGIKFRWMALVLALALMGFSIGTATLVSQRQAADLRLRLNQLNRESFTIAERFKDLLREVNSIMQRYGEKPNPGDLE